MVNTANLKKVILAAARIAGTIGDMQKVKVTLSNVGISAEAMGPMGYCKAFIAGEFEINGTLVTAIPAKELQAIVNSLTGTEVSVTRNRNKLIITDGMFNGTLHESGIEINPAAYTGDGGTGVMTIPPPLNRIATPDNTLTETWSSRLICIDPANTALYGIDSLQASIYDSYTGLTMSHPIVLARNSAKLLDVYQGLHVDIMELDSAYSFRNDEGATPQPIISMVLAKPTLGTVEFPALDRIRNSSRGMTQVAKIDINKDTLLTEMDKLETLMSPIHNIIKLQAEGDRFVIDYQTARRMGTIALEPANVEGSIDTEFSFKLIKRHIQLCPMNDITIKILQRRETNYACHITCAGYLGIFMGVTANAITTQEPGDQSNSGNEDSTNNGSDENTEGDTGNDNVPRPRRRRRSR